MDHDKAVAQKLLTVLNEFRKIRPTMPSQYIYTFVLVAMNEGMGVQDYAELADVSQSVMTRNLLDLGVRNRHKEPGFNLVLQRMDPMDMRKHQTFLTPEGKALWRRLLHTLG
jgi:DNA-binding MarR family transcriptional regulator